MNSITLRAGSLGLVIAPEAGGSVARFWSARAGRVIDWFRPAAAADIARRDPLRMSCFPLVPFSGLVRDATFRIGDKTVELPRNWPPSRHAIHGHGWTTPWRVVDIAADSAIIEYVHAADEWPWLYLARQRFTLDKHGLTIEMSARNDGDTPMPVGLGPHPYFPRTPLATITANGRQIWHSDDEGLPTALTAPPPEWDLRHGFRPADRFIDHVFAGWDRRAVIDWPEWQARLLLNAEARLNYLVVYAPAGEDYFCVEPVSNTADAFNGAFAGRTDTGTVILGPGETLTVRADFRPEF